MHEDHNLFNWCARSERGVKLANSITPSQDLKNLWAACKAGQSVVVESDYGRPRPGYRGIFFHTCGCNYPFDHVQDKGFRIVDRNGKEHIIDKMALHVTACHPQKLDDDERALLAALPHVGELDNREELEQVLRMRVISS